MCDQAITESQSLVKEKSWTTKLQIEHDEFKVHSCIVYTHRFLLVVGHHFAFVPWSMKLAVLDDQKSNNAGASLNFLVSKKQSRCSPSDQLVYIRYGSLLDFPYGSQSRKLAVIMWGSPRPSEYVY